MRISEKGTKDYPVLAAALQTPIYAMMRGITGVLERIRNSDLMRIIAIVSVVLTVILIALGILPITALGWLIESGLKGLRNLKAHTKRRITHWTKL